VLMRRVFPVEAYRTEAGPHHRIEGGGCSSAEISLHLVNRFDFPSEQ